MHGPFNVRQIISMRKGPGGAPVQSLAGPHWTFYGGTFLTL